MSHAAKGLDEKISDNSPLVDESAYDLPHLALHIHVFLSTTAAACHSAHEMLRVAVCFWWPLSSLRSGDSNIPHNTFTNVEHAPFINGQRLMIQSTSNRSGSLAPLPWRACLYLAFHPNLA